MARYKTRVFGKEVFTINVGLSFYNINLYLFFIETFLVMCLPVSVDESL